MIRIGHQYQMLLVIEYVVGERLKITTHSEIRGGGGSIHNYIGCCFPPNFANAETLTHDRAQRQSSKYVPVEIWPLGRPVGGRYGPMTYQVCILLIEYIETLVPIPFDTTT